LISAIQRGWTLDVLNVIQADRTPICHNRFSTQRHQGPAR
jgi:hypothetical protein